MASFANGCSYSYGPITVASFASVARSEWDPNQPTCALCQVPFNLFRRRHHCRKCGRCVCRRCSLNRIQLDAFGWPQRVCGGCVGHAAALVAQAGAAAGASAAVLASPVRDDSTSSSSALGERVLEQLQDLREEVRRLSAASARREEELAAAKLETDVQDVFTPSASPSAVASLPGSPESLADCAAARRRSIGAGAGLHAFTPRNSRPRGITGDWEPADGGDCYFEVLDAQGYRDPQGFPYSLGPFKLRETSGIKAEHLSVNFDDTMDGAGADVLRWSLSSKLKLPPNSGEPVEGYLSLLREVTLPELARRAAGIPEAAVRYAWFHPIFPHMKKGHSFDPDLKFLKNGGFVYFDGAATPRPLHICALEVDLQGGQLLFGKPKRMDPAWSEHLTREDRFKEISMEEFLEKGATHFCWISDNEEFNGEAICPRGGFAYRFGPPNTHNFCAP
eukprot:TRINITY_DN22338_c0_g1_i1.p1 TRINITY_DN22338_c0_g1~~TRINITY_DN22338_c0_g1_i1.p1  ORF type:complete len:469 (-),score=88.92 TRINITY_DN22338_c0_g1_i1:256-1602(-)